MFPLPPKITLTLTTVAHTFLGETIREEYSIEDSRLARDLIYPRVLTARDNLGAGNIYSCTLTLRRGDELVTTKITADMTPEDLSWSILGLLVLWDLSCQP